MTRETLLLSWIDALLDDIVNLSAIRAARHAFEREHGCLAIGDVCGDYVKQYEDEPAPTEALPKPEPPNNRIFTPGEKQPRKPAKARVATYINPNQGVITETGKAIGARAREARKNLGFETVVSFTEALGIPNATYWNMERGKRVRAETVRRFAELLKVSPQWLLTGEGNP